MKWSYTALGLFFQPKLLIGVYAHFIHECVRIDACGGNHNFFSICLFVFQSCFVYCYCERQMRNKWNDDFLIEDHKKAREELV